VDTDDDGFPDPADRDSDGDGVLDAEEVALGLDRRRRDSDGDGCEDAPEVALDGCSDPSQLALLRSCGVAEGLVSFTWEGPGSLSAASLRATFDHDHIPRMQSQAVSVVPAGGAGFARDHFVDVQSGATLTFLVTMPVFIEPAAGRVGSLVLEDGTGSFVDRGEIFVFGEPVCPVPHP